MKQSAFQTAMQNNHSRAYLLRKLGIDRANDIKHFESFPQHRVTNNQVTKSFSMSRVQSDLNLKQYRLLELAVSKINPLLGAEQRYVHYDNVVASHTEAQLDERTVVVTVRDYLSIASSVNADNVLRDMREAVLDLQAKHYAVLDEHHNQINVNYVEYSMFPSDAEYVEVCFTHEFFAELTNLKNKRHYSYRVNDVKRLSNVRTHKLQELLRAHANKCKLIISIDDLKFSLNIKQSVANARLTHYIDASIDELEQRGWHIAYTCNKHRRSFKSVTFQFSLPALIESE